MDESHTVETNRPQFFYVALCFIMFVFFVSTIVFSYLKRQPEAVIHEQDPCCMWLVLCQAAALHDGVAPEFGSYPASWRGCIGIIPIQNWTTLCLLLSSPFLFVRIQCEPMRPHIVILFQTLHENGTPLILAAGYPSIKGWSFTFSAGLELRISLLVPA